MELNIDQTLQRGIEAHKARRLQEADRLYAAILKVNPNHPDANHNMGVLAVSAGKVKQALPFFKIALKSNPNIGQFWLSYINALIKLNLIADAKAVLAQAKDYGACSESFDDLDKRLKDGMLAQSQDPGEEKLRYIVDCYNQKRYQEVLNKTSRLLKKFPNSVILYNMIGAANRGLRLPDEAVRSFKKVISINPGTVEAYNNLGLVLKEQGKLHEAIIEYKKAIDIKSDYAEAYYNLGIALKESDNLDEAVRAFENAVQIKPKHFEALNNLGNVFQEQGKISEAIDAYKRTLAIKHNFAEALFNLGNAFQQYNKPQEAIESYRQALDICPDYADALNNMGNTLYRLGRLEEAITAYSDAQLVSPLYSDPYNNMGNVLQEQGKFEEAIAIYKQALDIKPNSAEALNNLGNALFGQNKRGEAIQAYKQALNVNSNYAEAFNNLGNTFLIENMLEEAVQAYKSALAIRPDYPEAKHMISALMGETTRTAPKEYIENLFDKYATQFENSLVNQLQYNIPKTLVEIISKQNPNKFLGSVLDLGCGTGLTGSQIKQFCNYLEGIDLSRAMLREAKLKNVYDKLCHSDILEYLNSEPLNFDYFIASDVFVYIGDLADIFEIIKLRNKRSGRLVFSTEDVEGEGFHLLGTGRYSHSKNYIESLCTDFKYKLTHFSTTDLRKEQEEFLIGGLYVLDF